MTWVTLNDTTVRIDHIVSIVMMMEKEEPIFMVQFQNVPAMRVSLYATGGKWLYMICQHGLEEAKRGGQRYDQL